MFCIILNMSSRRIMKKRPLLLAQKYDSQGSGETVLNILSSWSTRSRILEFLRTYLLSEIHQFWFLSSRNREFVRAHFWRKKKKSMDSFRSSWVLKKALTLTPITSAPIPLGRLYQNEWTVMSTYFVCYKFCKETLDKKMEI